MPQCPILHDQTRPRVVYDQVKKLGPEGYLEEIGPGRAGQAKSAIPWPRLERRGDSDDGARAENLQRRGWPARIRVNGQRRRRERKQVGTSERGHGEATRGAEASDGRVKGGGWAPDPARLRKNTRQHATMGTGVVRVCSERDQREGGNGVHGCRGGRV